MAESLFQIAGVSSGISWDEVIKKSLTAAGKPITTWQNQIDKLEVKKTLYQEISSEFFKLRNTLTKMKLQSTYNAKTPEFVVRTTGKEAKNIVNATVKSNAEIASWDINVTQTAVAQRHISDRQADPGAALNITGSFRVHVGQLFSTINIESTDSLRTINQKLRTATDQGGNYMPIEAKLIDNRLVIESKETGLNTSGIKKSENLTMTDMDTMYLPRSKDGKYPTQLLSIESSGVTYQYNRDFTYDRDKGLITWTPTPTPPALPDPLVQRPRAGTDVMVRYSDDVAMTRSTDPNVDVLPAIPTGEDYFGGVPSPPAPVPVPPISIGLYSTAGTKYVEGSDYTLDFAAVPPTITWLAAGNRPAEGDSYVLRFADGINYETDSNKMRIEADDMGADSALAKLGLITVDTSTTPSTWTYKAGNFTEAQDAELTLNGVPVTRTSNKIEDLIANVTLDLVGTGDLTMNIVQDVKGAVEGIEAFVEAYNKTMTTINTRLSEKQDANNANNEEDYLSSIINKGKGKTTYGLLHGDQMISSIKDQMRRTLSEPIKQMSNSVATKKFLHPAEALGMTGSFYVYSAGQAAKINVAANDTLETLRRKLNDATSIVSSDGTTPSNAPMKLDASMRNDQLVINANGDLQTEGTKNDNISRSGSRDYDYLSYIPDSAIPVSGNMTVYSGKTTYTEGVDYNIDSFLTPAGTLQGRITWLPGGRQPAPGSTYKTSYEYNQSAVSFKPAPDLGDLSELDLHYDASNISLSTMGLTTEKTNFGKSGLLEFDSQKFMDAMRTNPATVATGMSTFMKNMDTYIGNLVDSSQKLVGGTAVTKGRIATSLAGLDKEIDAYNKRITKLEGDLKDKQAEMYKKYSDMEQAIQKLNAQMSSMAQYFKNSQSTSK